MLDKETLSATFLEFLPANMKLVAGEIEMAMLMAKTFDNPEAVKEQGSSNDARWHDGRPVR